MSTQLSHAKQFMSEDAELAVNRNVLICGVIAEIAKPKRGYAKIYLGKISPHEHLTVNLYARVYQELKDTMNLYETWCAKGYVSQYGREKYAITVYNQDKFFNSIHVTPSDSKEQKGMYDGLFMD